MGLSLSKINSVVVRPQPPCSPLLLVRWNGGGRVTGRGSLPKQEKRKLGKGISGWLFHCQLSCPRMPDMGAQFIIVDTDGGLCVGVEIMARPITTN